jgi:hypothetical protein
MKHEDHNLRVGQLVTNLGSLETVLRLFLAEANGQQLSIPKQGDKSAPLSFLTSWDSLGQLVERFNDALSAEEQKCRIDNDVVDLRDALAHGRLLSLTPEPPFTLYRFGKAANGQVPVESIETIDEQWLKHKIKQTYDEVQKVVECSLRRGHRSIPPP